MKTNEQLLTEHFSTVKLTPDFESRLVDACMASASIAPMPIKAQQQILLAGVQHQSDINSLQKSALIKIAAAVLFSLTISPLTYEITNAVGLRVANQVSQLETVPTGIWVVLPILMFSLLLPISRWASSDPSNESQIPSAPQRELLR